MWNLATANPQADSCSSNKSPTSLSGRVTGLLWRFQDCRLTALPLPKPFCSSQRPWQTCPGPRQTFGCRAMSFYGGSRLPFDRPENCPNAPAARRGRSRPVLGPLAAVQCLFMEVQGCRLTGLKTALKPLVFASNRLLPPPPM